MDDTRPAPAKKRAAPAQAMKMHSLDALRGVVLLWIVLGHAGLAFSQFCPAGWSCVEKSDANPAFDFLLLFGNAFAMQMFFVLAGLYAHILLVRAGAWLFFKSRFKSVTVPFIVCVVVFVPLMALVQVWDRTRRAPAGTPEADFIGQATEFFSSGLFFESLSYSSLGHLWFLWYLILVLTVFVATIPLWNPVMSSKRFQRLLDGVVKSPLRTVWLALPTTAFILVSGEIMYSAWKGPFQLDLLGYYLLFFFFGCYLHRKPALFLYIWRSFRVNLTLGLVFLFLGLVPTTIGRLALQYDAESARNYAAGAGLPARAADALVGLAGSDAAAFAVLLAGVFLSCVATWMLMFWVFGRANAYYSKPIPIVRYLTDASFFLYLAHFPLVKILQSLVQDLSVPTFAKFAIVAGATLAILLVLFHFFVRETWLGVMLGSTRAKLKKTLSA